MKIILIKKVKSLGDPGDIKEVKPGYARNFLIPQELAVLPGDSRAKNISKEISDSKNKNKMKEQSTNELIEKVNDKKFIFKSKTDASGKLYGSIGPEEISQITGIPEKYIKTHYKKIGNYNLEIEISKQKVNIKIEIIKQ